jgi:hypothetical protein
MLVSQSDEYRQDGLLSEIAETEIIVSQLPLLLSVSLPTVNRTNHRPTTRPAYAYLPNPSFRQLQPTK